MKMYGLRTKDVHSALYAELEADDTGVVRVTLSIIPDMPSPLWMVSNKDDAIRAAESVADSWHCSSYLKPYTFHDVEVVELRVSSIQAFKS